MDRATNVAMIRVSIHGSYGKARLWYRVPLGSGPFSIVGCGIDDDSGAGRMYR